MKILLLANTLNTLKTKLLQSFSQLKESVIELVKEPQISYILLTFTHI